MELAAFSDHWVHFPSSLPDLMNRKWFVLIQLPYIQNLFNGELDKPAMQVLPESVLQAVLPKKPYCCVIRNQKSFVSKFKNVSNILNFCLAGGDSGCKRILMTISTFLN